MMQEWIWILRSRTLHPRHSERNVGAERSQTRCSHVVYFGAMKPEQESKLQAYADAWIAYSKEQTKTYSMSVRGELKGFSKQLEREKQAKEAYQMAQGEYVRSLS